MVTQAQQKEFNAAGKNTTILPTFSAHSSRWMKKRNREFLSAVTDPTRANYYRSNIAFAC